MQHDLDDQSAPGRLGQRGSELQPPSAADCRGGGPEFREELGAGELCGQVSSSECSLGGSSAAWEVLTY